MQLATPSQRGLSLPPGTPRIDWSNPITRGLRNAWAYDGSNLPASLVTGLTLNQGTPGTRGASAAGNGFAFNGSTQIDYANASSISANNAFALFAFVTPLAMTASQRFFSHANSSSGVSNCALGISPTILNAARIAVSDGSANAVSATQATGTLAVNVPVAIGGNAAFNNVGTIGLYVNGVKAATAAAPAAALGTTNTTAIGGQRFNSSSGAFANAIVHLAAEWDRQLTDAEHEMIGQNPTCFLIYPDDEIASLMVGSASAALSSGVATNSSIGNTIATVTVNVATGGTAPYGYQWYRSTSAGFTPGAGNIVSGATSRTLNDTGLTNGTAYYYKCVVTDAVSATATSNQVSATPKAVTASGVTFSGTTASGTTVTTTAATGGTGPYTYQFQRAPDVSGSPGTYANVGTAGSSLSFTDSGLSASTPYWYRVVATDSLSATSTGSGATVTISAASSITSGTASLSSTGNGTVGVTSTASSGGSGSLTYQWYRSTDPAVDGNVVSGATSLTLNDTGLTNGTLYYYKLKTTDGSTTATSNQVSGVPATTLYLGVIGDSWTNTTVTSGGTTVTPSSSAAGNLVGNQLLALFQDGTKVTLSNQGVGGTNGNDWAPGGTNMNAAVAAFNAANSTHSDWTVLVHLGINDSSVNYSTPTGGESKAQYKTYLQNIVTYLLDTWGAGKVVLIGPPNIKDISSNHTATGVSLLVQYNAALQEIAALRPTQVFATSSEFDYITNNQSVLGSDKVHPTPPDANGQGGSVYVAGIWAKAVYDASRPVAPPRSQSYYRVGLR